MISCNISCLPHERDALLAFKNELHHPFLWQGFNCCEWRGVECSSHTSNVIKLHLANPSENGEDYWSSEGNGRLTTDLFQLKQLQHLDLSFNHLTGVLPKELRHLDLRFNHFEGEIPNHFVSLHKLAYLNLSMAGFNGTIPYQLGNLSQLAFLDLSQTYVYEFGIEIPVGAEIYSPSLVWTEKLRKLKYLSLSGVVLNMTGKQLEGPLSHLHNLQHLHLAFCMLSGHIPNAIQNLTFLSHLQLGSNSFEGSMPLWLANMTRLVSLSFYGSQLNGSFPLSLSHLPTLKKLNL
ncbi:hypothetical protein SUGI_0753160 [Cryptomeria japonica]|nr:hypothetical protein SUGI_0753160 [Cryptomeria japonica]